MDCRFEQTPTGWACSRCGWHYRRPTPRPPRRNCPKTAGTFTAHLRREAQGLVEARATDRTADQIEALGAQCEGCWDRGCPQGSPCRRARLWRERLSCGCCQKWNLDNH